MGSQLLRALFIRNIRSHSKYEEVYLRADDTVPDAKAHVGSHLNFYNQRRPHLSLDGQTPDAMYFAHLPQLTRAA